MSARYFSSGYSRLKLEDGKWFMLIIDYDRKRKWSRFYSAIIPDNATEIDAGQFERTYDASTIGYAEEL